MPFPDDLQVIQDKVDVTPIWNKDTHYLMIEDKWVLLAQAIKEYVGDILNWLANVLPTVVANISHPVGTYMVSEVDPSTLYNGHSWQLVSASNVIYTGTLVDGDWKHGNIVGNNTYELPVPQHQHGSQHIHLNKTTIRNNGVAAVPFSDIDAWEVVPSGLMTTGDYNAKFFYYDSGFGAGSSFKGNWDYAPESGTSTMRSKGADYVGDVFVDGRDIPPSHNQDCWHYPPHDGNTDMAGIADANIEIKPKGICLAIWKRIS